MDCGVEIHGFDQHGMAKYVRKSLSRKCDADDLLKLITTMNMRNNDNEGDNDDSDSDHSRNIHWKQTQYSGEDYILSMPLFLNILCSFFVSRQSDQEVTRAELMQVMVEGYIERESIRAKGREEADQVQDVVRNLGELAWDGLANPGKPKQTFSKVIYL